MWWVVLASLLFLGAVSAQQDCRLSEVTRQRNVDGEKLSGSWYMVRHYYHPDHYVVYENHALQIGMDNRVQELYVREYIRDPPSFPCQVYQEGTMQHRGDGVYEYYTSKVKRYVRVMVVYTDYNRYMTQFFCLEWSGDICLKPEVSLYVRQPWKYGDPDPYPYAESHIQLNKLCVDPRKSLRVPARDPPCTPITHAASAVVNPTPSKPLGPPCRLSDVKVMMNLDEKRLAGSWFNMRRYYSPAKENIAYDSYAINIKVDEKLPGLHVTEYIRYAPKMPCGIFNEARRRRIADGVYEHYDPSPRSYARSYIVQTDYDRYLTEFYCPQIDGTGVCIAPEVIFYSRELLPTRRWPSSYYFEDIIQKYNLCTSSKLFTDKEAMGPPCTPVTHPMTDISVPPTRSAPEDRSCIISKVKVMTEVDEERMSGNWYELRWYYSSEKEDPYQNHLVDLKADDKLPGFRATEYIKSPPGSPCKTTSTIKYRLGNGAYEYYSYLLMSNLRMHVIYTDYYRILINFYCLKWDGDVCLKPEVAFFAREPFVPGTPAFPRPEYFQDEIKANNLCVNVNKYMQMAPVEPPCTPVTHPIIRLPEGSCKLSKVMAMKRVDEERMSGNWYELRWYYSSEKEDQYQNYMMILKADEKLPGFRATEYIKMPPGAPCANASTIKYRLANGAYEYYSYILMGNIRMHVIHTDYDRHLINFYCLKLNGDVCLKPEVAFFAREPLVPGTAAFPRPEYFEDEIKKNNLCVNPNKYMQMTPVQPPCRPVTHKMISPPPGDGSCLLSKVNVMQQVDEMRMSGHWYMLRWYFGSKELDAFENYEVRYMYDEKLQGFQATIIVKMPPGTPCQNFSTIKYRLPNGAYEYFNLLTQRKVRMWVIYTDYSNYLITFYCANWNGDVCLTPEVAFFAREPVNVGDPGFPRLAYFEEEIKRNNLCVDLNTFRETPHVKPPCIPVTHRMTGSGPSKDPNFPLTEEGPCGCQPFDAEVMALMKEKEKAEIEKLKVEKDMLQLKKRLLIMKIATEGKPTQRPLVLSKTGYVVYRPGTVNLILSAPHGGDLEPSEIPARPRAGCFVNGKCVYTTDCINKDNRCRSTQDKADFSKELTERMDEEVQRVFGGRPHVVINLLHRSRLDANREIEEATFGNAVAKEAWQEYQNFISQAKSAIRGRGLFLDILGHGHPEAWTELGYLHSRADLNLGNIKIEDSSLRSIAELRRNLGTPYAEILRGATSFGRYLNDLNYVAVPSPFNPKPDGGNYFSGGYNTRKHGSRDGGFIDAIQICAPRVLRDLPARTKYAADLATCAKRFMDAHYPRLV